jgi:cytochrome c oxidase cbb3-type subunit I/II
MYYMIPKIYNTTIFSKRLINLHFWLGTLGILFWVVPMYIAGFTQGMMWKEFTAEGTLKYGNFLEIVVQIVPMYMMRALGGFLYLTGAILGAYNIFKTVAQGRLITNEKAEAVALTKTFVVEYQEDTYWHRWVERKPMPLLVLSLGAVLIGSLIELVPTFMVQSNVPTIAAVQPYTALEIEGRDLYIREGCVGCHSQMVRPFRSETERYGEYSKAGEFVYDHPFLWGSKRTGPDLHRQGGKYLDSWQYLHLVEPTSMSPGSIMPKYDWLKDQKLDLSQTTDKLRAMQTLGVPYTSYEVDDAAANARAQAQKIADNLAKEGIKITADKEMIALIAYLQRLGTDIKK